MHFKSLLGNAVLQARRLPGGRMRPAKILVLSGGNSYSTSSDGIVRSPYGTMEFPNLKVHECIYENLDKYGRQIAVECSVTGRNYTYNKLRSVSRALAASFQNKLKLVKGDVVAVYLPNLPEYPVIFLAGSEAGIILSTINSSYKHEEVARQLESSGSKVIFTTISLLRSAEEALKSLKKKLPIIIIKEYESTPLPDGTINFMEFVDPSTCGELKPVEFSQDDLFVLPYSSGTTGLPKGVQLMHRNIVANILQMKDAKARLGYDDSFKDIALGLLPMFHIYGMTVVTLSTLNSGGKLLAVPKFEPLLFIDLIARRKITSLYLVPPLILFLSNHNLVKSEFLKHAKFVISGASPIGQADMDRLLHKANHLVVGQGYGMTETSPVTLLFTRERSHKAGATGVPIISTEAKVVDPETGKVQTTNGVGEIWVRGPQVMKGYLNNPKANEDIFDGDWLKTGDLGYFDEDGDFFISDRIKDLIKVKGFQVAPAELEELLRSHPKIIDAAVIGVRHDKKGEVPKAFVVVREGMKITEEEVKEFVKSKVAAHKQLDGGVVFISSIPKSAAGKILKKDLR